MTATLTPHQASMLRVVDRHLTGSRAYVPGSEVGSATALQHLARKGYLTEVIERGPRGGEIRMYGLTDLARTVLERQSAAPQVVRDYFGDETARPTVEQVFVDSWLHTGWDRRQLTVGLAREMRRAGVKTVSVRWSGRVADFQIRELTR